MNGTPKVETADSRAGFSKGDRVKRVGGPEDLPEDGAVQGWFTLEYAPTEWQCTVTWGGRYIGRYQAHEIEHATPPVWAAMSRADFETNAPQPPAQTGRVTADSRRAG